MDREQALMESENFRMGWGIIICEDHWRGSSKDVKRKTMVGKLKKGDVGEP
jgi:hypothetical protein